MISADLHETLHRALSTRGGLFQPTSARMGLYHMAMDQRALGAYYRRAFVESFRMISDHLAMLNGITRDKVIGQPGSAVSNFFLSLPSITDTVLTESKSNDPTLASLTLAIEDAIERLAAETHYELTHLRSAAACRIEGLPDRLLKTRALADDAVIKSLHCEANDRSEWLGESATQFSEVLDQPVGSRDPMSWLLFGWIKWRREGAREDVVRAMHQACLTSSTQHDEVYQEAHRHLAMVQAERGDHDAACQSILKALDARPSALLMVEGVQYAAQAGRMDDAFSLWERALAHWPFALLALIESKELLLHAPKFAQFAQESEKNERNKARKAISQLKTHKENTERLIEEQSLDVSLPASISYQLDQFVEQLKHASAPAASFIAQESARLAEEIHQVVGKQLERAHLLARNERQQAQGELEHLEKLKDKVILGLEHQNQQALSDERVKLGLIGDNGPSSSGCMASGAITAVSLTVYFVLCTLMPSLAARIGPNTAIGAFLMLVLGLPAALGGLHVFSRITQQWGAEKQLETRTREIDENTKAQIRAIESDFRIKQQAILDRVEQLRQKEEAAAQRYSQHQNSLRKPTEIENLAA